MTMIEHRVVSKRHDSPHSSTDVLLTCACGWLAQGPERDVMAEHAEHVELEAGRVSAPPMPPSRHFSLAKYTEPERRAILARDRIVRQIHEVVVGMSEGERAIWLKLLEVDIDTLAATLNSGGTP